MRPWICGWLALMLVSATGCTHQISLHDTDTSWHYDIGGTKQDASVVVVIPPTTMTQTYAFHDISAGLANKWEAQPGEMLRQVCDVEFPQMFSSYEVASVYRAPAQGNRRLTLTLDMVDYVFEYQQARATVRVQAFDVNQVRLLDKTYNAKGKAETAKVVFGGAFAMKSAVRQSSLDAYRAIFNQMRPDLYAALNAPVPPAGADTAASPSPQPQSRATAPGGPPALSATANFLNVEPASPESLNGRELYLCCNMVFDDDQETTDANYLLTDYDDRTTLPMGTRVVVIEADREHVSFRPAGKTETFKLWLEYGPARMPPAMYFPFILRRENPADQVTSLPPEIAAAIRDGRLAYGMTREQAAMARGLPPFHQTASIEAPEWLYYDGPDLVQHVTFTDAHITSIKAGSAP